MVEGIIIPCIDSYRAGVVVIRADKKIGGREIVHPFGNSYSLGERVLKSTPLIPLREKDGR